jgi:acylphosphatase
MKRVQIVCKGRVQGVFFRKYTYEKAKSLGLYGWVMNQFDGSVLIKTAGEQLIIDEFINWCYQGSPLSLVEELVIEELEESTILPEKFEIRY